MSLRLNALGTLFESEMRNAQSLLWAYSLAQAALESRYFNSGLVKQTNNAWGIKYVGQQGAEPVVFMTTEYGQDGKLVRVEQRFCKWDSVGRAVRAYYRLVERHYPDAWDARTPEEFYKGMKRWATDPSYYSLCMRVYRKIYDV